MCGRYNIIPNARAWVTAWQIARDLLTESDWRASYNITPSRWVPVIRATARGDGLVIDKARWGFIPRWVKDEKPKAQPANARSDGVATKPYFRDSFRRRRCLFIISGYYEWETIQGSKQPFHIRYEDGSPLLVAGVWDTWRGDDTAALTTTDANPQLARIHDRMPAIIGEDRVKEWFFSDSPEQLLQPYSGRPLYMSPISKKVNNPKNDDQSLIEPLGANIKFATSKTE
jgi:putative SOS response-associated peptidase YedK